MRLYKYIEMKIWFTSLLVKYLKNVKYCNKIMKKSFEKELIITKEKERNFQMANKCHICNNFYSEKGTRLRHKR